MPSSGGVKILYTIKRLSKGNKTICLYIAKYSEPPQSLGELQKGAITQGRCRVNWQLTAAGFVSLHELQILLFKSPWLPGVTLCFCTSPYADASTGAITAGCWHSATDFCSHDNIQTVFHISFILARLMNLTYRLP